MNMRSLLSLTFSVLLIALPGCCWKSKKCCPINQSASCETVDTETQKEETISKF